MTIFIAKIEGQEIPLPETVGGDDAAVKRTLAPFYPEVGNAMITRTTTEDGGTVTINIVKKSGTKGAGMSGAAYLDACPERKNPAIALLQEINALQGDYEIGQAIALESQIDAAIQEGEQQAEMLLHTMKRLDVARPTVAPVVVQGF